VAPLPVNVAVCPAHITAGLLTALTVGIGFTVTSTVEVPVHPALAPVTVYVVLDAGETVTFVPTRAPGFHVYVVAPLPVNVAELPAQIAVGLLTAETVGLAFTVIATVVDVEQEPFEPVTV